MECPVCGCLHFYIKDPDDEYEIYEFEFKDGKAAFDGDEGAGSAELKDETETYCNRCSWHGRFGDLSN
jgi:hypothetical protein